jgi:Flp pilus assembly protein TadD
VKVETMTEKECLDLAEQLRQQMKPILQGHSTLLEAFNLTEERIFQLIGVASELAREGKLNDSALILGGLTLVDPDNALLHSCLGAVLMKLKQNESALSELSYAVELDPSDISARVNLGEVSCQLGDLNNAIAHLEKAILLDPSGKNSFANRARTLLLLISNTARDLQDLGPGASEKIKEQIRSLPSIK